MPDLSPNPIRRKDSLGIPHIPAFPDKVPVQELSPLLDTLPGTDILGAISGALPFAAPVLSFFQGLFGDSPEEQYNKALQANIKKAKEAVRIASASQRNSIMANAESQRSFARQRGARTSAAEGLGAVASVFSLPEVGNINQNETAGIASVNAEEEASIANIEAGNLQQPSYAFPSKLDFLGEGFGAVNSIMNQKKFSAMSDQRFDRLIAALGK